MNIDKIWLKSMSVMAPTCHQRADRSYHLRNYQMPICSRCLGIYIGYFVGLFFYLPKFAILFPLTYIDGFIQIRTKYTSTNFRRLTTGIISGTATIQILKLIIVVLKNKF